MIGQFLVLLPRFALDRREGEDDIPEQHAAPPPARPMPDRQRKDKHIGRRIVAAIGAVEPPLLGIVGQDHLDDKGRPHQLAHAPRQRRPRRRLGQHCRLRAGPQPHIAMDRDLDRKGVRRQAAHCAILDRLVVAARGAVARLVGADDPRHQRVAHHVLFGEAHDRDVVDPAQRFERVGEARAAARAADRPGSGRR